MPPSKRSDSPYLSAVIPIHNAAVFLADRLRLLSIYLEKLGTSYEIIAVDDGSTDHTTDILSKLDLPHLTCISRDQNGGKFAAIRDGMRSARGTCRLFTDADIPYELSAIRRAVSLVCDEKTAVVVGDRTLSASYTSAKRRPLRRLTTRMFSGCVRFLIGDDLHDTQCGFKAFRGDIADAIFPLIQERRFAGDVEVLAIARLHGLDIVRIPVTLRYDGPTTVRPIKDGLEMLQSLAKIRRRRAQGEYDLTTTRAPKA